MQIMPLTPVIGAEIHGVDLSGSLTDKVQKELREALITYQVIFFRDQNLTLDQHKAFGRLFGELHIHPTEPSPEGHPEVITIHADENSNAVAGMKWHSDVSCDTVPPMGSILHMHEVPAAGGDTLFASMYRAYETLSAPIQTLIGNLFAWHESIHVHGKRSGNDRILRDGRDAYPESLHPIVCIHPETNRKVLFVNENFTTRIEGLGRSESEGVLKILFDHIATPEFQCRFRWQPKSVAFWDNRSTQHRSVWDYYPACRHGYRVTITGEKPGHSATQTSFERL